jgi:hypothetical protein
MTVTFKLEQADGTPAEPPTIRSAVAGLIGYIPPARGVRKGPPEPPRLRFEGDALLPCVRVVRSSVPLHGESSRSHREIREGASHGFEKSVRVWSIGIEDGLSATELVPVVLTTKRRRSFDQPVFDSKDGLPLFARSVVIVRERQVRDNSVLVGTRGRLLLPPEEPHDART